MHKGAITTASATTGSTARQQRRELPAALIIALNMIVAVALAHAPQPFTLSKTGAYCSKVHAFYIFGAPAIAMLADGKRT